jgi:DNA-binding NarL/FixJ family response regulator
MMIIYIPAIILTTSNNRVDVMECYKIGIAGYLIKPLNTMIMLIVLKTSRILEL